MANGMFAKGREAYLGGSADFDTAVYKVYAVDTVAYTVNLATHQFVDAISSGARLAVSPALTGKSITDGIADADPTVIAAVPAGPDVGALVLAQTSAVGGGADVAVGLQLLICYWDTATGIPMEPNGGALNVTWNVAGIFKL